VAGLQAIADADVIVYDRLANPALLEHARPGAELIYAGKEPSGELMTQERINQLLCDRAAKGNLVVRLKGGDPFVFGRGGEEAEEIVAAGIDVEIVPGISSSIAGPAYAGIPVTHRSYATSLTLVTAHESEGSTGVRWPVLAQLDGTIVFMMGFGNLPLIVKNLTEAGMASGKPVAVISKATTAEQRTVTGTLADIEARVAEAGLPTPALIVVGEVVRMREAINWFEKRPLFGTRIVVTRAREQASELKRVLEESGASVLQFPVIEIAPPDSWESLDRVAADPASYQGLIFTSVNGVNAFFERLHLRGSDTRALHGCRIAAVGEATAAALRDHGVAADLVPEKFQSAALLPLLEDDQRGIRTAVIRAAEGREELIDELRRRGGEVDLAVAYRTKAADSDLDTLRRWIEEDAIDIVTFTSASTVERFFEKLTEPERTRVMRRAAFASIGPATSEALRRYARDPEIEAANATLAALHDAVVASRARPAPPETV
jgi:uroporphyrinogen III methyltransferase/synthase